MSETQKTPPHLKIFDWSKPGQLYLQENEYGTFQTTRHKPTDLEFTFGDATLFYVLL